MPRPIPIQTRSKPIYNNCSVYSPEGTLMFRCSMKKIKWYLDRDLARPYTPPTSDSIRNSERGEETGFGEEESVPQSIILLFTPKGSGRVNEGEEWYLEERMEVCVVCGLSPSSASSTDPTTPPNNAPPSAHGSAGASGGLTLHHIIPHTYTQHFPLPYKSHSSHDILPLCIPCHLTYEARVSLPLRRRIADEFGVGLEGGPWVREEGVGRVRSAARALIGVKVGKIPEFRKAELEAIVRDHLGLENHDPIPAETLAPLTMLEPLMRAPTYTSHGESVVRKLLDGCVNPEEERERVEGFVRMWRKMFLEVMGPRFLEGSWRVGDVVGVVNGNGGVQG
ncbi:hypothetical protein YB2330_004821 [Saitoella coloradoensis]